VGNNNKSGSTAYKNKSLQWQQDVASTSENKKVKSDLKSLNYADLKWHTAI
jgi:hypothetical protein